jgi:hypothetical protein
MIFTSKMGFILRGPLFVRYFLANYLISDHFLPLSHPFQNKITTADSKALLNQLFHALY